MSLYDVFTETEIDDHVDEIMQQNKRQRTSTIEEENCQNTKFMKFIVEKFQKVYDNKNIYKILLDDLDIFPYGSVSNFQTQNGFYCCIKRELKYGYTFIISILDDTVENNKLIDYLMPDEENDYQIDCCKFVGHKCFEEQDNNSYEFEFEISDENVIKLSNYGFIVVDQIIQKFGIDNCHIVTYNFVRRQVDIFIQSVIEDCNSNKNDDESDEEYIPSDSEYNEQSDG